MHNPSMILATDEQISELKAQINDIKEKMQAEINDLREEIKQLKNSMGTNVATSVIFCFISVWTKIWNLYTSF